jgi:hypothetical protein
VAFEKKPAPGFYDTGAEASMTKDMQQEFRPTTVEEMEGKRRKVGVSGCVVVGGEGARVNNLDSGSHTKRRGVYVCVRLSRAGQLQR